MPRSKSIPGSKTGRTRARDKNKEQIAPADGFESPEVKSVAAEAAPLESVARAAEPRIESETKATQPVRVNAEARKMEVVKNDLRKNLVPINLEDEIRRRAFELYQQRGTSSGSEADDWLAAEREVRQRYRQQSA